MINNNLIGMVSGLGGGLNHISSLQGFEQCSYPSAHAKGPTVDPRYAGPQGAGMVKYNQVYKPNQVGRIGQCRSHDKIVGAGSQSFVGGSTTSLREDTFLQSHHHGIGHNFQVAPSNAQQYSKI